MSKVRLPVAPPQIDQQLQDISPSAPLPIIGECLSEEDQESVFNQAMTSLQQSLVENDVNRARIATMVIATVRKGGKQDDGIKLKTDERFVDSIATMIGREFAIPSQLAEYEEGLVDPADQ